MENKPRTSDPSSLSNKEIDEAMKLFHEHRMSRIHRSLRTFIGASFAAFVASLVVPEQPVSLIVMWLAFILCLLRDAPQVFLMDKLIGRFREEQQRRKGKGNNDGA